MRFKDYINEGTDDFTGVVTKSMPFYLKGARINLKTKGSTFYAEVIGDKIDPEPVTIEKFKNKEDAMKWLSGLGIKEITWDKGKGKAKF